MRDPQDHLCSRSCPRRLGWLQRCARPALLLPWIPLLLAGPAVAAPIDLICSLAPAEAGGPGTFVDFSLPEGSGSGSSFWPAIGQRRPVLTRVASGQVQILQPGQGGLLFSINRPDGSISSPGGQRGRCTNAGPVRVDRAF